jgi:hypothetical protein
MKKSTRKVTARGFALPPRVTFGKLSAAKYEAAFKSSAKVNEPTARILNRPAPHCPLKTP